MGNCAPKKNKKVPKIEREKLRPNPLQIPTKLHQVPDSPSPRHLHFDLLTPRERSRGRSLPVSPQRTSEIILSRQLSLRHHSISKKRIKSQRPIQRHRSASLSPLSLSTKYPIKPRSPKEFPPPLKSKSL